MTDIRREALRRKYLGLGLGELTAATVFGLIAAVVVQPDLDEAHRPALWSALVPLLIVLLQAATYWLAARTWVERAPMPVQFARVYSAFRIIDIALLTGGLAGMLVWWPHHGTTALFIAAVWLFGVVEYINYFHIRLSYAARRWFVMVRQWRTPRLVKDLRAATS